MHSWAVPLQKEAWWLLTIVYMLIKPMNEPNTTLAQDHVKLIAEIDEFIGATIGLNSLYLPKKNR